MWTNEQMLAAIKAVQEGRPLIKQLVNMASQRQRWRIELVVE